MQCSVEKNTATTRFYNSITARFNIYFNGLESFKAGVAKINNGHHDDYAEMLNVFEFSDPSVASLATSDMDRAIQKASKLISLKSITARPEIKNKRDISENEKKLLDRKEYNEWVDDSYLLIGKSRFYKREYSEAESVFNYCTTEANDSKIKTEAYIWLARIKAETDDYSEASRLINEVSMDEINTDSFRFLYNTTLADIYIRQEKYQEAIEPLTKAINEASGKRNRYRLTYLLAQLYEHEGNSAMATESYRKVAKMNPPYEVEFNARINMAGVFDINTGNPTEIRRELEKMLRDPKNRDFRDQIYYALAGLSMKEGNEAEALDFYRKSAAASTANQNQRGRSYLSLADYYYDRSDYKNAGLYLDSAVLFIDQKHPRFTDLKSRSQNLKELITQLVVIEREDSLQRVAALPSAERNTLIASIIQNISNAGSQARNSDNTDRYNLGQYYENEQRFQGNIEQEGKWYFYNQSALTFGRTEFKRRWGDRRLEDNWRRSNRASTGAVNPTNEAEGEAKQTSSADTAAAAANDRTKPEYYLKDLPLTDSMLNISNEKLSVAFLNAAKIYSEKINDQDKANETYEVLLNRFPNSPLIPEALYELYRNNSSSNQTKAETYRQRLLEKYPETEFAKILSDPDYYRNKMADIMVTEKLYEESYDLYQKENFEEAIAKINKALEQYPENQLAPKFMLLHAYCVARLTDERTFREDLKILTDIWPGTPESAKALELISSIDTKVPELKVEEEKVVAAQLFTADTTGSRIFALVIPDPTYNINQATFDVISYNIDYYTNKNYKTEGSLVDNKFIIIKVSGFTNFSQAVDYYTKFQSAKPVRNPKGLNMPAFVISPENMDILQSDKNPERYEIFFRENLLK
jgi:tetratricopeptide (TPR) repeat protein